MRSGIWQITRVSRHFVCQSGALRNVLVKAVSEQFVARYSVYSAGLGSAVYARLNLLLSIITLGSDSAACVLQTV